MEENLQPNVTNLNNVANNTVNLNSNEVNTQPITVTSIPQSSTIVQQPQVNTVNEPSITTVSIPTQTVIQQPQVNTVSYTSTTYTPQTDIQQSTTNVNSTESESMCKLTLDTSLMNLTVQKIKKCVKGTPALPLSMAVQLMFTPEGLIVKATDLVNVLIQKLPEVVTNETISVTVNIDLFAALISKITTEKFLFIPENGRVTIKSLEDDTQQFSFILLENRDTTGRSIDIPDNFGNATTATEPINYEEFRQAVTAAKVFMGNSDLGQRLNGIYVDNDSFYSTNRANAVKIPNTSIKLPEGKSMFLSEGISQAIENLELDTQSTKVSFSISDDGIIDAIQISDNTTELHSAVNQDYGVFPLDLCTRLFDMKQSHMFSFDKRIALSAFDIISLFIRVNIDKDSCLVVIDPTSSTMTIQSKSGDAKQVIPITNTQDLQYTECYLNLERVVKALKNLSDDNVICMYNPQTLQQPTRDAFLRFESNNVNELISYTTDL